MSVDPTTLDGMTLSLIGTPYQGPPGNQGVPGNQGLPGNPGREVEIHKGTTHIQWRYVGDTAWINIVSLAEITGPKGQDGLNGKDGQRGLQGIPGQNGTNGVDGTDGKDGVDGRDGTDGTNGVDGQDGADGADGQDGREIELQKGTTYVQWRYVGDPSWINLVSLAELKGAKGDQGQSFVPNATEAFANRSNYDSEDPGFAFLAIDEGMIYFRLDPTGWSNGMPFGKGDQGDKGETGDTGADGREVEFQRTATHIQWRYIGSSTWINLVPLVDLKGDKGDKGDPGDPGTPGTNGTNGQDGADGRDGVDGAPGTPGADGADGADGIGISSAVTTYQAGASGTEVPTGTWLSSVPAVTKGQFLWTRTILTYTDANTSTIYSVAYQGQDGTGGSGGGTEILLLTAEPTSGQGSEGSIALVRLSSGYMQAWTKGASTWTKTWEQPLANTSQAQAAEISTIPTTPAGVREYMEQFGLTSTYTTAPADLNSVVRGAFLNWGNTTANAPVADSCGRGICIPSVTGYVTQWSIENNTGLMHVRFQENGTWSAWTPVGAGGGGGSEHGIPAGGTAGQMLAKASGDDYDAEWVDPPEGGGGGGDTAFVRALAPNNIIIQSLTPVTICSVALTAASAYHVQFRASINDNASAKGIAFSLDDIDKREMALRVGYREASGDLVFKMITEGGVNNGVTFAGSANSGPGNLVTIDGFLLTGAATTLTVRANNAEDQWDYRQVVQGASLSVEKIGTVTLA